MTHPLFDIKEWGRWDGYIKSDTKAIPQCYAPQGLTKTLGRIFFEKPNFMGLYI